MSEIIINLALEDFNLNVDVYNCFRTRALLRKFLLHLIISKNLEVNHTLLCSFRILIDSRPKMVSFADEY